MTKEEEGLMASQHIFFKTNDNVLKTCMKVYKRSCFNYLTKEKTFLCKEGSKEISLQF
jgi:hypothetical protein